MVNPLYVTMLSFPNQLSDEEMDLHCPAAAMPREGFGELQDLSFMDLPQFEKFKPGYDVPESYYREDLREPGSDLLRPAPKKHAAHEVKRQCAMNACMRGFDVSSRKSCESGMGFGNAQSSGSDLHITTPLSLFLGACPCRLN